VRKPLKVRPSNRILWASRNRIGEVPDAVSANSSLGRDPNRELVPVPVSKWPQAQVSATPAASRFVEVVHKRHQSPLPNLDIASGPSAHT
jgi:hypothetical protein